MNVPESQYSNSAEEGPSSFEIGVVSLTLSHIFPVGKSVARLSERWERLYIGNETLGLQDAGNCCGLSSITDKAWPFDDNGVCHEVYNTEIY